LKAGITLQQRRVNYEALLTCVIICSDVRTVIEKSVTLSPDGSGQRGDHSLPLLGVDIFAQGLVVRGQLVVSVRWMLTLHFRYLKLAGIKYSECVCQASESQSRRQMLMYADPTANHATTGSSRSGNILSSYSSACYRSPCLL
jgi:hypothetical protein